MGMRGSNVLGTSRLRSSDLAPGGAHEARQFLKATGED